MTPGDVASGAATDSLFRKAVEHHRLGNLLEAEADYLAVLRADHSCSVASHNLGVLCMQMGRHEEAQAHLIAALNADPSKGQYWLSYIDALFQSGQIESARETLLLARQNGLQGDEVEALANRLSGNNQLLQRELVEDDIVVIDSVFPMKTPFSFRNTEVNGLFEQIDSLNCYAMFPMMPGGLAWFKHGYGVSETAFKENKSGYLRHYPANEGRVRYLYPDKDYRFRLAYLLFLAETYTALPFLEKYRIPFVFELYPGGAFGLDNPSSDEMLKAIFNSPYFRKVITTQKVTYDYLLSKNLCPKEKIVHLFGGILQFPADDRVPRQYYKADKGTFDICFVAAKYTPRGVDKGYDLFIGAARQLAAKYDDMRFHVIGGFDENEIDVSDFRDSITFYGFRQPDWLRQFYPRMDICLSPNRPFQKYAGDFDGYPMGCEQSLFGVAMFTTDPLGNNDGLYSDDEIVLIEPSLEDIISKVDFYYNHPDRLYRLAVKGGEKTRKLFDLDDRLKKIAQVLKSASGTSR